MLSYNPQMPVKLQHQEHLSGGDKATCWQCLRILHGCKGECKVCKNMNRNPKEYFNFFFFILKLFQETSISLTLNVILAPTSFHNNHSDLYFYLDQSSVLPRCYLLLFTPVSFSRHGLLDNFVFLFSPASLAFSLF